MKSERLKKLETELNDLEEWLRLGLVPKKDIEKHEHEIEIMKTRLSDEKERLRAIKENGDLEEFSVPKRNQAGRQAYQEPHTMPGVDMEADSNMTDAGLDMETDSFETQTTTISGGDTGEDATQVEEDEEDPFSDKNRWRRGILEDPESDSW